jgi:hypothetical protein
LADGNIPADALRPQTALPLTRGTLPFLKEYSMFYLPTLGRRTLRILDELFLLNVMTLFWMLIIEISMLRS